MGAFIYIVESIFKMSMPGGCGNRRMYMKVKSGTLRCWRSKENQEEPAANAKSLYKSGNLSCHFLAKNLSMDFHDDDSELQMPWSCPCNHIHELPPSTHCSPVGFSPKLSVR